MYCISLSISLCIVSLYISLCIVSLYISLCIVSLSIYLYVLYLSLYLYVLYLSLYLYVLYCIIQVVGVDYCGRFIDAAMKIQGGKVVQYGSQQVARLPSEAQPSRVQFKQVSLSLKRLMYITNT